MMILVRCIEYVQTTLKIVVPLGYFNPIRKLHAWFTETSQYLLSWSSTYELWLLFPLETGNAASIVITKPPQEAMNRIGTERKAFLPAFGIYYYDKLPQQYFPFRDTTTTYSLILNTGPR